MSANAPTTNKPEVRPHQVGGKILVPLLIVAVALVLLLIIVSRWDGWRVGSGDQHTEDAYVHADIVPLSTRVSDTLRQLNVNDFQAVHAGDLIAQLDDTDYSAQAEQAKSKLAGSKAALGSNQVEKQVQSSRIAMAVSDLNQALAAELAAIGQVEAAKAAALYAAQELARQEALFAETATTRQTLQKTRADDEKAQSGLQSANADREKAASAVHGAEESVAEAEGSMRVLSAKDASLRADIRDSEAAVRDAEVQVGYTHIYAPMDGRVGERKVFPGQLVTPGMEIISLVEGAPWVQANFEETQLGRMRVGDRADVHIDALAGAVFHGTVREISPASGSQTALLPPDNATGNYTKVVQRLPVKIALDTDANKSPENARNFDRLRPGFSAEVTVYPSSGSRTQ